MVVGCPQTGKSTMMRNRIENDMKFKDFKVSNSHRYISYVMTAETNVNGLKRVVE